MNFSNVFPHLGKAEFSPNGSLVIIANNVKATIFDVDSLDLLHQFSFPDMITDLGWSNDNTLIFFQQKNRSQVIIK